jgi:drug/metabolite transporter (DMT)-like permease
MKDQFLNDNLITESQNNSKINKGMLYVALSNTMFGIINFLVKYTSYLFPESFDVFSFNLQRVIILLPITYFQFSEEDPLVKFQDIKNKFWFIIRITVNFVFMVSFVLALSYLRVATVTCINSLNPLLIIILSVFILKEKFFLRYIVGISVGLIGTFIIILNEKNSSDENQEVARNIREIMMGLFFSFLGMSSLALLMFTNKIMTSEKLSMNNQGFYIGISNSILSLLPILVVGFKTSLGVSIFSVLHGSLYYVALSLMNAGLSLIDLSRTVVLSYISTIVVFLMGVILLGEPLYFSDIIGSLLIISFNIYNTIYPVKV